MAALLVVLGGTVASCGAERSSGAEKPSRAAEVKVDAPGTYYLHHLTESDGDQATDMPGQAYSIGLRASGRSPGKEPLTAKNVKVTIDLSAVTNRASIERVDTQEGCARSGDVITCSPRDVEEGKDAIFAPFSMKSRPGAAKGPAGPVKTTVTSANAPTVHHTTQLVIGSPFLTSRQEEEPLTGVQPGSEVKLTPAFGNRGDIGIDDDLSLVVEAKGQTSLRRQYGNCRYDKAVSPAKAVCQVSGPLPAGAAYETDKPITAVADRTGRQGKLSYTVYRAHDMPIAELLPGSAPRGTGAPLGLRPVDGSGSGFAGNGSTEQAGGELTFRTTRIHDLQTAGFTIKGRVGRSLDIDVLALDGGHSPDDVRLTLPEGVSLEGHREGEPGEILFCGYTEEKNGTIGCPGGMTTPTLRVRIDKRVEGAQGTISVRSDPKDPDPDNNSAPIKVEYLD
ncbi:hypothetical protein SSP35_30_00190 [Streptomyces sp. NBRC 110611]|nr:hypothetical protein SSP35_30_00190 [Streptomyces sp. NBRC 110611]